MAGTDGQVYIRFLNNGDEEAFRFLYEKYREGLVRFLYGMVQNIEDAEELMMDTFAVLISGTAHYTVRKDAEFKTWLYAVARNQARVFLRRHREMPVAPENMDCEQLSPEPGPESMVLSDERKIKLWQAMQSLHTEYRQVLYLTYYEDMSPSGIARIMQKTVKQVYNLSTRAKAALKENLEGTGEIWDIL